MKFATFVIAVATLAAIVTPRVQADEWNKKTIVTFGGPVEIPGKVLGAGTYVFKLVDSASDRHIVQIFDKDERKLYGTILAIPDYRTAPTDKTVITFEERAAGSPEAVREWFYPGDNFGQMFVYPKVRAAALAAANQQPVPSMPDESMNIAAATQPTPTVPDMEIKRMSEIPLKVATPAMEEVEVAEVFPARSTALPQTATLLPVFGMAGILALCTAALLRVDKRR